jgi:hypothetical protein
MTSKKGKTRKAKTSIYERYREILDMPDLTDKQIDQMRKHLGLFARTICEHVWGKKFY